MLISNLEKISETSVRLKRCVTSQSFFFFFSFKLLSYCGHNGIVYNCLKNCRNMNFCFPKVLIIYDTLKKKVFFSKVHFKRLI